jgi:hypothetical protein
MPKSSGEKSVRGGVREGSSAVGFCLQLPKIRAATINSQRYNFMLARSDSIVCLFQCHDEDAFAPPLWEGNATSRCHHAKDAGDQQRLDALDLAQVARQDIEHR